jgi:hypothetical protein
MWFTAKNTADDGVTAPSTISDDDWRDIQRRAAKANPRRFQFGTDESVEATRAGRDQYRNRKQN